MYPNSWKHFLSAMNVQQGEQIQPYPKHEHFDRRYGNNGSVIRVSGGVTFGARPKAGAHGDVPQHQWNDHSTVAAQNAWLPNFATILGNDGSEQSHITLV